MGLASHGLQGPSITSASRRTTPERLSCRLLHPLGAWRVSGSQPRMNGICRGRARYESVLTVQPGRGGGLSSSRARRGAAGTRQSLARNRRVGFLARAAAEFSLASFTMRHLLGTCSLLSSRLATRLRLEKVSRGWRKSLAGRKVSRGRPPREFSRAAALISRGLIFV